MSRKLTTLAQNSFLQYKVADFVETIFYNVTCDYRGYLKDRLLYTSVKMINDSYAILGNAFSG
jgi:hypothetical protein